MRCFRFFSLVVFGSFVFSTCAVQADYKTAVLADGPIAYYTLDEVGGGEGTAAPNLGSLGKDADGEFYGEEFEEDAGPGLPGFPAGNKALRMTRFNETGEATPVEEASGVIVEEPILDDLQAFTLSGWINPSEAENSQRSGLFGQDNAIEFGFIGANDIHFWAQLPDGGDVHTNHLYEFDNDEWHHLALTGDGEEGEVVLYLDGEEIDWTQNNALPLDELGKDSFGISEQPFYIGGGPIFGGDRQYAGGLDEIAVFDKALTQEQIQAHYNAAVEGGGDDPCDFDGDGALGLGDVNALRDAIIAGNADAKFDVDGDGSVASGDVTFFVSDASKLNSWIGDANLDGEFNSSDFVAVFQAGKFETGQAATWEQGDWNADGVFGSGDFVAAFQAGGFEMGPRAGAAASVPEPAAITLVAFGFFGLLMGRRRR